MRVEDLEVGEFYLDSSNEELQVLSIGNSSVFVRYTKSQDECANDYSFINY
jgi:hypothetical protein